MIRRGCGRGVCFWLALLGFCGAAAIASVAANAAADEEPFARETAVFGTFARVVLPGAESAARKESATAKVFARWREMHRRYHAWEESELRRINEAVARGAYPIAIDVETRALLLCAQKIARASEGLFDPAVGALAAAWGFHGDDFPPRPPPAERIAAWLADPPSIADLRFEGLSIVAAHPQTRLDLGAIGKGAALDEAGAILRAAGIDDALIDVGGGILALGANRGRAWRILLRPDPDAESFGPIELRDGEAVSSAGGGRRFFEYEGRRYHHILDPRTGWPAANLGGASAIIGGADAGKIADALATALAVADDAESARILARFADPPTLRIKNKKARPNRALAQRL